MKFNVNGVEAETTDLAEIAQIAALLGWNSTVPKSAVQTVAEALATPTAHPGLNGSANGNGAVLHPGSGVPVTHPVSVVARPGVNIYLPVTKFERDALVIMRTSPHVEWTSATVADEVSATNEYRHQLMSAVSKLCRGGRGVRRGRDNIHYVLDEFGREAILRVFKRPSAQWDAMRRAAEAGREWNPNAQVSRLLEG